MIMKPLVVKLGGSLIDVADSVLDILMKSKRRLLVVPGGGNFADGIRELLLDDNISHWLAILAMDYNGWILASKGVEYTDEIEVPNGVKVLLPYRKFRSLDPLPHSWDVTSDTIAAWVASMIQSDLLILKSVDGIYSDGKIIEMVDQILDTDSVDPSLIPYVLKHNINTFVLNGREPERLSEFLHGGSVKGSLINTGTRHNH